MDPSCPVLADESDLAGTTDVSTDALSARRRLRRRGRNAGAMRHDTIIADCAIGCKATSWMPRKKFQLVSTEQPASSAVVIWSTVHTAAIAVGVFSLQNALRC